MSTHNTSSEGSLSLHPRKGREGKGRDEEHRDEVPIHLQSVEASPRQMDGRSAADAGGGRR